MVDFSMIAIKTDYLNVTFSVFVSETRITLYSDVVQYLTFKVILEINFLY